MTVKSWMLYMIHDGFFWGLGCAPIVAIVYGALRYLDHRWSAQAAVEEREIRQSDDYRRGFEDGLRSHWLDKMSARLDESINEKLADIRAGRERFNQEPNSESRPGAARPT